VNIFDWLLRRGRSLTPPQRERLAHWRALPEPGLRRQREQQRYVVVDVESTGLDVLSDQLLAIGAVTIEASHIVLGQSFRRVLRQDRPSEHANILVHGIGGAAQTAGDDPVEVLLDFLDFIGKDPLVGFHAQFDEIMLHKASRRHLGQGFRRSWIDLAYLAPALHAEAAGKSKGLDDWLSERGIVNYSRHDALADALATAQLFLALDRRAESAGMATAADLLEAARSQAWLAQQRR
jgi:DNA polymerase-3 subunit epsilon